MAGEPNSISSYIEELKEGREIVIVSPDNDRDCDSSIFWKDISGKINSWSRTFGHMCRTDMGHVPRTTKPSAGA